MRLDPAPPGRASPATLRAAAWTIRALLAARRQLATRPLDQVRIPAPPRVPSGAERGVYGVIGRVRPPCLARSLIRQRWHAAQGDPRALLIGVAAPGADFRAHAWLEGDDDPRAAGLTLLSRHPAPSG